MEFQPLLNDKTSTISIIDQQHNKLIDHINRLYEASISKKMKLEITEILEDLTLNSIQNFRTEEQLMFSYGYKEYYHHKDQHTTILHKLIDFKVKYHEGKEKQGEEMALFLEKWLINHFSGPDKTMCVFFKENGVF